jgi:hypothetical protein
MTGRAIQACLLKPMAASGMLSGEEPVRGLKNAGPGGCFPFACVLLKTGRFSIP